MQTAISSGLARVLSRAFHFTLTGLVAGVSLHAQPIVCGSFNLRMATPADSGNLWVHRAPLASALIRFHAFDIFGTQEGFRHQLNDLERNLPEYTFYGAGRDDGREKGEHSAIFFRKGRFELLERGDFWLSETPDQPSLGWDATCCHRLCTWVKLRDRTNGRDFFVFNAHYDHQGVQARKESSQLILQRMAEIAGGQPLILTGDLNGNRSSAWYQALDGSKLLRDSYRLASFPYDQNGSFNGFGRQVQRPDVIDHIFVSADFLVARWGILSDSFFGKFPSDHFPVLAELRWK